MPPVRLQLRLMLPQGRQFGPGKAELLTLIEELGSIAAAGRRMQMSYKRAWGLVEEMNAAFSRPLVVAGRGGAERGGAQVTDLGRQVLASYRALEAGLRDVGSQHVDFIASALAAGEDPLPGGGKPDMSDKT